VPVSRPSLLKALASVGLISSAVLGVAGWLVVSGISDSTTDTARSAAVVIDDVSTATDAAVIAVSSMTRVVEDIESVARSSGRTLSTVEELLTDVSDNVAGDIADSLESSVDAMPGVIQTGRVIDRTLSALTLVGVDYDPEVPLDDALESLRDSLEPLPDEIRAQAVLLDDAAGDLSEIAADAGSLSASLLEIRLELLDAERMVRTAALDVDEVSRAFGELAEDVDVYGDWAPWLPVAAAVAIASGSLGLLVIGSDDRRRRDDL
jgi:hypothetical protein